MNGVNSRMQRTEERISELENRTIEINQTEKQTERLQKKLTEPQGFVPKPIELTFMLSVSEQDKKGNSAEKVFKE